MTGSTLLSPLPATEVPIELIELGVPEPLVLVHPSRNLAQRLAPQRNQHFAPLLPALDEPSSLEEFEVLGDGVQRRIERPGNVEKARRPFRGELPDDRSARGVRYSCQDVGQVVHGLILHQRV